MGVGTEIQSRSIRAIGVWELHGSLQYSTAVLVPLFCPPSRSGSISVSQEGTTSRRNLLKLVDLREYCCPQEPHSSKTKSRGREVDMRSRVLYVHHTAEYKQSRVLTLRKANLSLIPGTLYGSLSTDKSDP